MDTIKNINIYNSKVLFNDASKDRLHLQHYVEGAYDDVHTGIYQKAYDFMHKVNADNLNDISLTYFNSEISYGKMFDKIEEFAKALKKYGISKGDYVSICMPNVPEVVYFKYALNRIGAIACMIDPRTNPERILSYVNDSNSKLLISIMDICDPKIDEIINSVKVDDIVVVNPSDGIDLSSSINIEGLGVNLIYALKSLKFDLHEKIEKNSKYLNLNSFLKKNQGFSGILDSEYEPNIPAVTLYTSGTTGISKGAQLSNEAYNSMAKQMSYGAKSLDRKDTFLGCIPFFSAYGSFCGMHNSLSHGWNIIMIPQFNPNEFDKLIKKYKPNNALGVPRFWESLVKNGRLDEMDLSFLKIPVTGGDNITPSALKEINEFLESHGASVKLKVGYGATEFGGVVATTLDNYDIYEEGSVGPFLPGCIGKVINPETGKVMGYGEKEAGELYIYSPTMMLGYLNYPEETEKITYIDEDGRKFYKTGDKAYITDRGIIYVIDRYKRAMMRPDGHTVHATPIENVISSHPLVSSCAVVGIKQGEKAGVIPTAFLVLKNNDIEKEAAVSSIDELCLKKLPERDRALAYTIVDKLPYTLMGKINFKELEKFDFSDLDVIIVDNTFFKQKNKERVKR